MQLGRIVARHVCKGFILHDEGDLSRAAEEFGHSYRLVFRDVSPDRAMRAGDAFARALAAKDAIDVEQNRAKRMVDPRWDRVYRCFLEIADLLNVDPRWAYHYNQFWLKHKAEVEYWSDVVESERYWTQRLLPSWQDKRSDGQNGPGPLPFLYAAAVEAHDLHTPQAWEMAEGVMTMYFDAIFAERESTQVVHLRSA
ncbi:MAG: hypothetical protein AAFQ82_05085 [Myxococcota bacterium]